MNIQGKRYILTKVIKGVTGGFMPAVPTRIVILDIDDHTVTISQQLQSDSENAVEGYLSTTATVSIDSIKPLVEEISNNLKTLPIEEPRGAEDIYGYDTSIIIESPGFRWQNTPNQGCNVQISKTQPTSNQRELFKSIVDKLYLLVDQHLK